MQDHERDDSAVILNFNEGLVIVTGCCHSGIVNTITNARKISGVDKIHAVIGGLHLIDASEQKLEKSVEALNSVDWVFAGHCTGFESLHRISEVLGERFQRIHSGTMIHLPVQNGALPIETTPPVIRDLYRTHNNKEVM